MFPEVYKKFYAVLAVSFVLGLGAMTLLDVESLSTTGLVVEQGIPSEFAWPIFLFGLFVGTVAVGLVLVLIHYEHKRL